MISSLTTLIVILGSITVILSVFVAFSFKRHYNNLTGDSKRLTTALSWQLAGEAAIGAGTLVFALAAHFGHLPHWPIWFQSLLRFIMFFATSATTIHLYRVIRILKK